MRLLLFGFLLLSLFGCHQVSDFQSDLEVVNLLKAADSTEQTNKLRYLQEARLLLQQNSTLDDSLRMATHFKIGTYYRQQGILDSAATQLFRASEYISSSLRSSLDYDVFDQCWGV